MESTHHNNGKTGTHGKAGNIDEFHMIFCLVSERIEDRLETVH